MTDNVQAKICGLNSAPAVAAAVAGGAAFGGFVFYPRSPRAVSPAQAAALAAEIPATVRKVGLFVDAAYDDIAAVLEEVPLDMLQCHGGEAVEYIAELRGKFGLPVIKAVAVSGADDLILARSYQSVADMLLFDAKPPKSMADALPGGNALSFDWTLISGQSWEVPWMLAGGLRADNIAEAVAISGARFVDISSGVESAPGVKDPAMIAEFLKAVQACG